MRFIIHNLIVAALLFFCGACNKSDVYTEKAKTIDSLSGAINSMANELSRIDTLLLRKSISRYNWYKQFILQNINDTITKAEADHLQHFYASGKNLESFILNRKLILERAELINSQLEKLAEDLKTKKPDKELVSKFAAFEKSESAKIIEAGYQQQKLFHTGIEEFTNSLKGVELLIKTRNNGELPTIVKDSITL